MTTPAVVTTRPATTAPVTTAPMTTAPVTTGPVTTPSTLTPEQSALLEYVPESQRLACVGGAGESLPAGGFVAGLHCQLSDGVTVWYFQYDSADSMQAGYRYKVKLTSDTGDCEQDVESEGAYTIGGEEAGRLACFDVEGWGRILWWTHGATGILSAAARADGDRAALYHWWLEEAGPIA